MKLRLSLSGERPDSHRPDLWARFEAVGMIRSEFLLRQLGTYWTDAATREFAADYVGRIARLFSPRPVWYRTSDLWSNEANPLRGIDEIWREDNPIVGKRGTRRGLLLPALFEVEIRLIASVAQRAPNLHLLTSFVGDADEFARAVEIARRAGWPNRIGSMLEVPSAVLDAKRFIAAGATNLMLGLNDLTCLLTGAERGSGFDAKTSPSVWWCVAYVRESVGSSCEWGIAGGLSRELLVEAERADVPYASLHYADLPQLMDVNPQDLADLGLVREIKKKTRERARAFRIQEAEPGALK